MGVGRSVLLLLFLSLASTAYAQSKDAKACALKIDVALEKPTPAASEALLKQGYDECGDGHGFLAALAQVAAAQGEFESAVELCLRELRQGAATTRAVDLFIALFPRVSDDARRKMLELGTSADTPINLPRKGMAMSHLIDAVYCGGTKLVGNPMTFDPRTGIARYNVECPRGKVTPRYARFPVPDAVAAGANRAVDRRIETDLGSKFGVRDAADLREIVQRPLTADRSHAWLISHLMDVVTAKEIWALLVRAPA